MFESIHRPQGPNWKLRLLFGALVFVLLAVAISVYRITQMPLQSHTGPLPNLSGEEAEIRDHLRVHVNYLSEAIGERNLSRPVSLQATANYLRSNLAQAGYTVAEHTFLVDGHDVSNLEVTLSGVDRSGGTIIVGAHYDTAAGAPGANDNSSGVAAVLELARLLQRSTMRKTVRFVLFVNEEPPYFQTDKMGSVVYARQLRQDHVHVSAMISLETIGYYSDVPDSQKYPALLNLFYPSRGNFVGFVGNPESRDLVRLAVRRFRETSKFPSEGIAAPADWPGIGWSDQWSFWQQQYPGIMITDTAPFRYPYYHTPRDTANHVDFDGMSRVVEGIRRVIESLAMEQ
jgi:hypothetical protein